jgi:hypothetical protein
MSDKKCTPHAVTTEFSMEQICFGFDRATDERSLVAFLAAFSGRPLLHTLASRLADEEILAVVDFLTGLMKKHLTEKEYHRLFLAGPQTDTGRSRGDEY